MRQDLAYALRQLRRNPGFAAAVVTTLALGLGGVTAVFSVLYGILLRPLPIQRPGDVVGVYLTFEHSRKVAVSGIRFDQWARSNDIFTGMAAAGNTSLQLRLDGNAVKLGVELVSGNFFEFLGVAPIHGRVFTAADEANGASSAPAVIAESLWRQQFAADQSVLGRPLVTNDVSLTIVGVVPDAFARWRQPAVLWAPYRLTPGLMSPETLARDGYNQLNPLARLRPGLTVDAATPLMEALHHRVSEAIAARPDLRYSAVLVPVRDLTTPPTLRRSLWILSGVTVLVLVLATANVTSLMLTRAVRRRREFATRLALGAGFGRLTRQLLIEVALLAVLGGAAGVLFAAWTMPVLIALAPAAATASSVIVIDWPVVTFAATATLSCLLLVALVPVARARRTDVTSALRWDGSSTWSASPGRVHALLVLTQTTVATPVIVAAALLVTSVFQLARIDLGFDPRHLMTMRMTLPSEGYANGPAVSIFRQQLLEQILAIPGVERAAVSTGQPLRGYGETSGIQGVSIDIEGGRHYLNGEPEDAAFVPGWQSISAGYFRTVGIPLRAGRGFTESDRPGTPRVAVVNEAMARMHWGGENPLGKRVRFDWPQPRQGGDFPWTEVVGVVADARHFRLDAPARPEIYMALSQTGAYPWQILHVRSSAPADDLAAALRRAVRAADPRIPLEDVRPVAALAADLTATPRYSATLISVLGAVALVLACVGVYGLGAFAAADRAREIGIRVALGATRSGLIRQALARGLIPALIGLALGGVATSAALTQLKGLLYGVEPTNPWAFVASVVLLLVVAAAAAFVPARRAANADPMIALRAE